MNHEKKPWLTFDWLDDRDQVKLDLRKFMRRVENVLQTRLKDEYNEAMIDGTCNRTRLGLSEADIFDAVDELRGILQARRSVSIPPKKEAKKGTPVTPLRKAQ